MPYHYVITVQFWPRRARRNTVGTLAGNLNGNARTTEAELYDAAFAAARKEFDIPAQAAVLFYRCVPACPAGVR